MEFPFLPNRIFLRHGRSEQPLKVAVVTEVGIALRATPKFLCADATSHVPLALANGQISRQSGSRSESDPYLGDKRRLRRLGRRWTRICLPVLLIVVSGIAGSSAQNLPPSTNAFGEVVHVQNTLPPDPKSNGSNYLYPVRTWEVPTQRLSAPRSTTSEDEIARANTRRMLQQITVSQISFDQTRLIDALEYLKREYQRSESSGRALIFTLREPPLLPPIAEPIIPGLPPGVNSWPTYSDVPWANRKVSLTLPKTSLLEALQRVAAQTGLKAQIDPNRVTISAENKDTFQTREFDVPPEFFGFSQAEIKAAYPDRTPSNYVPRTNEEAKSFLESEGLVFPSGASAIYLPWSGKLIIRTYSENFDKLKSLLDQFSKDNPSLQHPANP